MRYVRLGLEDGARLFAKRSSVDECTTFAQP